MLYGLRNKIFPLAEETEDEDDDDDDDNDYDDKSADEDYEGAASSKKSRVTFKQKREAVAYYFLENGNTRKLSSVQNRHRYVKNKMQLNRWKVQVERSMTKYLTKM